MLFAELTEEGHALIAVAAPRYAAAIERAFGKLTEKQRSTLSELLRLLYS
jgi:DNA-binding MarR family transcriptional regulator